VIEVLHDVASQSDEAPGTIALAWLIHRGMTPIFGATKMAHIEQAAKALNCTLDDEVVARLTEAYVPMLPVEMPYTAKNQAQTSELSDE
jgi:aryl-alcohol dehydrogenase-like predicted oxidoreductase